MNQRISVAAGVVFFLTSALDGAPAVKFPEAYPPANDIRIENLAPIRMRDGVTLYADVYRPA